MTLTLNEIPDHAKHFQDHPEIAKAKRREIIEKQKHPPLIERLKKESRHTLRCPDCGCEFDPKIHVRVIKPVEQQTRRMNILLDELQKGGTR